MSNIDKVSILLVDDRPENLLALEAIIEREDYLLVKATSGEEALRYLLKYDFAVVLLDVQMPGIDGYETAKIIKAREKTKNVPIIFITANNMDSEHIFTGYSSGAIDYILKPIDPFILKSKVDAFVNMYRLNQKLHNQTNTLYKKTKELEKANLELRQITSELRVSEALANVITETSIDSKIIIDRKGTILKVNPAVYKMFQYESSSLIGNTIYQLFPHEPTKQYVKSLIDVVPTIEQITGNEKPTETIATRKNGEDFPVEIIVGKKFVEDRYIIVITVRDITKQKQFQEKIQHMAYHDWLTNLPNRRLYNDTLNKVVNEAKKFKQSLALLYLDMNRFKYINDSLGHLIGDRMLQNIANLLQNSVSEGDFIARIGGDEFILLLPDSNREDALECAEKIIEAFKKPFYIDNYEIYMTTSIGISVFPYDGEDAQVLMKNADAALYRAKELGRNNYSVYHSGMNIESYRSFILRNDLYKALERDELTIVYQPRYKLETGTVQSVEALLRWNHPNWGTIYPSEFIPLAEESGQIVEIGVWLLRTVCKQSKKWEEKGISNIRISINFSAIQFMQKNLINVLNSVFAETDVEPHMIEIEIKESVVMGNEEIVKRAVEAIKEMGIIVSIDDFGMGYASLNYLRYFPVDRLKIDRSFIKDVFNGQSDTSKIVASIISLSNNLGLEVVAEGVETEEQLTLLRKYQCDEIQGYLFCPPIPPEEIEVFLLNYAPNVNKITHEVAAAVDTSTNHKKIINLPISRKHQQTTNYNQEILQLALQRTKDMFSISTREMEVFELIVEGYTNKEISEKLFISEHTVKNHITRILHKLNVTDRIQAMAKIYQACIEEGSRLNLQ